MSLPGDALRLSLGTLTLLPVPPPRRVDRRTAAAAMGLAPFAALPVAALGAAVAWALAAADAPPMLTAALALAALALGSGALHLDGLADTADGLAVPGDRARSLEVMRRGDVGPAGAAALVLVLLVQVSALAGLAARELALSTAITFCLAVVASRAVLALACARGVPAARPEGLGRGVAGSVHPMISALVVVLVAAVAGSLDGWRGAGGVLAAVAAVGLLLLVAGRRLGGVTGDVMGACVEVALAAYLVTQVVG